MRMKDRISIKGGVVKLEVHEQKPDGTKALVPGMGWGFDKNIIVNDASELLAQLAKLNTVEPGITHLAVGVGDGSFDPQNPPAPTVVQNTLVGEIFRKVIDSTTFVISGVPTVTRTNVVDFVTALQAGQGTGALKEVGLFGGTGAAATDGGTMINYFTFPVINKQVTQIFTFTWRLTF